MGTAIEQRRLPLIPLRNTVIFPNLTVPLSVGRPASLKSLEAASDSDRHLVVVAQRDPAVDEPVQKDLYDYGVVCKILKTIQTAEGHQSVIVQGQSRCRMLLLENDSQGSQFAMVEPLESTSVDEIETQATLLAVKELAYKAIELNTSIPDEAHAFIEQLDDPSVLSDVIASNMNIETEEKQALLEMVSVPDRLHRVGELLSKEVNVLELSQKIKSDVKGEIDKSQREYFLREQLKAIRKELGEDDLGEEEHDDLREQLEKKNLPEKVRELANKELGRLARVPTQSPEYSVIRTYLDWIMDLPWDEKTGHDIHIKEARAILDEDHFDLDKVKKRIIEYLSVIKLKETLKGPILCLVGPPGVGKTSLGKSVAKALGREFVRISLGGVRDEAEVRGHRRTYIGAMPGRILQGMKKAKTVNPVFVLDEIDKLGNDYRGDPSSALLEVLDPEQNGSFSDHYLEVEYDLSQVLFIATANRADTIPPALLDRMEIIEIEGYTVRDKVQIAERHLWPRIKEEHGLEQARLDVSSRTFTHLIEQYTREAGVRTLRREMASLARGVAARVVEAEKNPADVRLRIKPRELKKYLGPPRYIKDDTTDIKVPGVAVGLAWTPVGGDILYIEATRMPGKGRLVLTGKLGDVMKESAQLALDYVKSNAERYHVSEEEIQNSDVHIHVPEGAIPKDGPSAGVTMLTAITSLFTDKLVSADVAMTGEITLRGAVLPVGGIKSKVIAAARAGIKTVCLPAANRKDYDDIPAEIRKALKFHFLSDMDDYLAVALKSDMEEK